MLNFQTHNFTIFPVLLFFVFCFQSNTAQNFDDVISSNRYINCDQVTIKAASIIDDLYDKNQIDKIYDFLDYWESKCGQLEEIQRLRTIFDIDGRRFIISNNRLRNQAVIEDMLEYRSNLKSIQDSLNSSVNLNKDIYRSLNTYNKLTQDIARRSGFDSIDESLILDFYASDVPDFSKIKNAPESSLLKESYSSILEQTKRTWESHYSINTGMYLPYGNISLFGIRPTIGWSGGGRSKKHNVNLITELRFGPSSEEYDYLDQNELITDDTFYIIYFGLIYSYDIFRSKKFEFALSFGPTYETNMIENIDQDVDGDGVYLPSFGFAPGFDIRYNFGKRGEYIGFHFRFNSVNYRNPGGTQLDGQYVNLRLVYGQFKNKKRTKRLDNLK